MSKILPKVLQVVKNQNINIIAAVADRNNFAARKVLERSGFANIERFDSTKDLFQTSDWIC
jgi:predicted acetyltransferase